MRRLLVLIGALVLAGCGGRSALHTGCVLSKPGGALPPREALLNFGSPVASRSDPGWYGNGALWTQLPTPSQFTKTRSGMLRTKMGWFRAAPGVVRLTAHPVGGAPARFSADIGTPAEYGRLGFAPGILEFGRVGCWEVDAQLGGRRLRLVMRVFPPV
jgi:hypothetical protein